MCALCGNRKRSVKELINLGDVPRDVDLPVEPPQQLSNWKRKKGFKKEKG